ncbi:Pls/PosA family non-ribosomal peptide synthetase [Rhodococcus sp. APC 3903]|uniref:Pls/PosA family non-ribosomal peptide synthetase n=1 Tax=Rhodococcus sp. APC 3903 TaxID=3035193 RepID=UPI0025B28E98|nr:Pls/PosA family non-ribosomal peptide synthetase [Rhodococcus sp. APC 3903]MDN3459863.1 amino acid adenylation domain-containing protein [Rhodococcus sp. APC 3903]
MSNFRTYAPDDGALRTMRKTRRLHHFFEETADRVPDEIALESEGRAYTYADLDNRANQLSHFLISLGAGARIAILLDRSAETYLALLATLKAGAAFVPIDPESPAERIGYITGDADVDLILSHSRFGDALAPLGIRWIEIDSAETLIDLEPISRPESAASQDDPSAYILYTSGSTGRPKGVDVAQSSICNFLDIVPTIYDVRQCDRVYQGMSISFDFSIEEIWPTWAVGASLIAGPTGTGRLGGELADFLESHAISVVYCVPTLLATIPREIPSLRTILVGGEACPQELVERWARPGRRILNTYGPTEATVTATWCELLPGRPVTIGVPLPTYSVFILDEQHNQVTGGEVGEICIGGPGVARGYVGRPELTAVRFIEHPLAGNGRLYRTGDLGRVDSGGKIQYLGRADSEVKIRGHRVDLGEIESTFLVDPDIASAVVSLVTVAGVEQLASWVVLIPGAHPDLDDLVARLSRETRRRLPAYMIPAFLDIQSELPMMPSGKVDRPRLPKPTGRRLIESTAPVVAPTNEHEHRMRELWAGLLSVPTDSISIEADFFIDLGGHSLAAAQLVTQLRESGIGSRAGIRDIYANPTVRSLTASIDPVPSSPACLDRDTAAVLKDRHTDGDTPSVCGREVRRAGVVQGIFLLVVLLVVTIPVSIVYSNHRGQPSFDTLIDLLIATVPTYLAVRWVVPVLAVPPLSAGIRPGRYRLWSTTYLRLWMVNNLMTLAPTSVLSGSPLMTQFLRALGATIGRDTYLGTATVPFPALVTIGDGVSIGYNTDLRPWRVVGNEVVVAPILIGPSAYIAANCVLGPGTTVGPHAMLGDQSPLPDGTTVPAGQRWIGSPAERVDALDDRVEMMAAAGPTRGWTPMLLTLTVVAVFALEALAIATIVPSLVLVWIVLLEYGMLASLLATLLSGTVYVISVCAIVGLGKRIVLPHMPVGCFYEASPLGVRKWIADKLLEISLLHTNSLYATLYTPPWLRLLGAKIGRGAEISTAAHLDPDLLTVNDEAFVADMASLGGSTFCNGRMNFAHTEIGTRAFIGNAAVLPSGMSTGEGSLVGVLTVPPTSGVSPQSSWLGNPAMFLPARQASGVYHDSEIFAPPRSVVAHRLAIEFFRITLPATVIGISLYFYLLGLSQFARTTSVSWTIAAAPFLALTTALGVVLFTVGTKNNLVGAYHPRIEPLWAKFVRRSEFVTGLYESAAVPVLLNQLIGTPFLPVILRWYGARIGKSVWMGTTYLTEFDLVHIGDAAVIESGVSLQTHLFEDRVMKMSSVTVSGGSTVGARAVVLYDTIVGEGAELESLSLLMKGEQLPPHTAWRGIPAQAVG